MHSWCKKCKQYDGRESKNVPCRRKALGAAWHMWLPSLGSTPGSGTRRGRFNHRAAIARALPPADFRRLPPTNRKCCGPWTQRPFSGSGFGPGSPSLVFPHPALRPATPHQGLGGWVLRPFPYLTRHLSQPSWGDKHRIVGRPRAQALGSDCRGGCPSSTAHGVPKILTADVTSEPVFSSEGWRQRSPQRVSVRRYCYCHC